MLRLWKKWIVFPTVWLSVIAITLLMLQVVPGLRPTEPDMESFQGQYQARLVDDHVELDVHETVSLYMSNRGITRSLPARYGKYEVPYSDFWATQTDVGANQRPVTAPVMVSTNGRNHELRIGTSDYKSGLWAFDLQYTLQSAMVGNKNYQELYFNTNGTGWKNGFQSYSTTLTLDPALLAARTGDVACYQGTSGSKTRCDVTELPDGYQVSLPTGVEPHENVTIAVGFQQGTATTLVPVKPGTTWGRWGVAAMLGVGLLAVVVSLFKILAVRRRDKREVGVVTQFEPPKDLLPILAADFLGKPERGAAAHAAWLAVNGHASLIAPKDGSTSDLRIVWKRDNDAMSTRVQNMTQHLFGPPGDLNRITNKRSSELRKAQQLREQLLRARLLSEDPPSPFPLFGVGFAIVLVLGVIQCFRGLAGLGWYFIAAGLVSVLLLVAGVFLDPMAPKLTEEGKEQRRYLLGLEEFIGRSEAEQLSYLQGVDRAPRDDQERVQLYMKLLPWAIVFGLEKTWAKAIGALCERFPDLVPDIDQLSLEGLLAQTGSLDDDSRRRQDDMVSHNAWSTRKDVGESAGPAISSGWNDFWSNSGSSSGWSGGGGGSSSSSSSSSGSSGGGSSGGGMGGGGGGRW